jgi:hypothetical protein
MEPINYFSSLFDGFRLGGIRSCLLGLACSLAFCAPVQAQKIYVCKDATGRTLTSDRPIPECANRAMKEMNGNGVTTREIPAPLTAEQIRQKKEAEEKKAVDEKNAQEQKKRDQAILTTYKNEQQIETERQRAVTQLRNNINIALTAKGVAEQRYKAAQSEITILKEKGALVPGNLRERVVDAEKAVQQEARNAEAMEAELGKAKARYDDITQRYRAAVANSGRADASPPAGPPAGQATSAAAASAPKK